MSASKFLTAIWPAEGPYCIAVPHPIPDTKRIAFRHRVFDTVDEAATFCNQEKNSKNIFFCVHTLKKAKVWNATKKNFKTGELGAWEVRTQANMKECKAFFFDLDVGEAPKYTSQREALEGLKDFCTSVGLPKPAIVSSGGGLHVYWLMEEAIPSDEWKEIAFKLKRLATAMKLKLDPMRTTDTASVLRVAGTFNLKTGAPRPVKMYAPFEAISRQKFEKIITKALRTNNISVGEMPKYAAPAADDDFNNTAKTYDGPPASLRAVAKACAQMRYLVRAQGNVSEPEWYNMLNIVRFVEDGARLVHKVSEGHPDYDVTETDHKVQRLWALNVGPTSCAKLADVCGPDRCIGCKFAGKVKNPLMAARFTDEAEAPVITRQAGTTAFQLAIPDPPPPFYRLKDGSIAREYVDKENETRYDILLPFDLHPTRHVDGDDLMTQHWRVNLPITGYRDFTITADTLYDKRKFGAALSNQGIYFDPNTEEGLKEYMVAYIKELQKLVAADPQYNHLGWIDKRTNFVLPDKVIMEDGSVGPVSLSNHATNSTQHMTKHGTLAKQIDLIKFYDAPAYAAHQFYILCGLAAPLYYMTGHHGIVVNAMGESGLSKSSALYTAASFWGHASELPINGTNTGITHRARTERITTWANLPICVDEITKIDAKDATDMVMGITQPGHRVRLDNTGAERKTSTSYKATIMMCSANASLNAHLSADNSTGTAGAMRLFEIAFPKTAVHEKFEADAYLFDLKENCGWIGEEFIAYVVKNRLEIEARVKAKMQAVDKMCNINASERFWGATIAAVLVAGEIAVHLGLLSFDMDVIKTWIVKKQVPYMRGVVSDEYANPLSILGDYLETINQNITVIRKLDNDNNTAYASKGAQGALLARHDVGDGMMWVLKSDFAKHCRKIGANPYQVLTALHQPTIDATGRQHRIVPHLRIRKVLGAGTDSAKMQVWCFGVDMTHPEVCGMPQLEAIINPEVKTTPPKGKLKVVSKGFNED